MKNLRLAAAALVAFALPLPASAFWPVIDPVSIAKEVQQLQQTVAILQQAQQAVAIARQNMQALPGGGGGLVNIAGRIAQVDGMLTSAQAVCTAAQRGRAAASRCNIESQTANAQMAQLGGTLWTLQGLQRAAAGTSGALGASQATAAGIANLATQLQAIHQAQLAATLQREGDANAYAQAVHGKPAFQSLYAP
jgi:hypothetical protein